MTDLGLHLFYSPLLHRRIYNNFMMQNNKQEAYVALNSDQTTLTFYYDDQRKLRKEKTWDINERQKFLFFFKGINLVWKNVKTITKMVFDASFKDYIPTNIKDWFNNCKTLKTIEGLQFLNTSQVKEMSNMFGACYELTALNLSGFDTSKVTNMWSMFCECGSLTTLDLSHFDTSNVTDMSLMFSECGELTSLNVSSFDTSKVEDMNGMFIGCAFSTIDVSHFDTSKVEDMSNMFFGCDSLTTIYCNSTWNCENSESMFAGCTSLRGAVPYDEAKTDASMANPERGYFTSRR